MKRFKMAVWGIVGVMALFWSWTGNTQEILLGYTGPLSGPAAEYGQDIANGIDMAVRELNAAGGVTVGGKKYTFKFIKVDDRVDPTQAVNNARRLKASGAIAIFNGVFTTIAPMMKINEEKGNEFIMMAYTSTPRVEALSNKLLVDTTVGFTTYVPVFTEWALKKGWKKCAMVVTLGSYGDEWRSYFRQYWEKNGGTITADKPANYYTETDFSTPLAAAMTTHPDVMLVGGPSATTALVIEQARAMGYKGGFMMIDQANPEYIAVLLKGTELMGNAIGAGGVASVPSPGATIFAKKYTEQYRRRVTWECVLNYTATHALAHAIVAAGTVSDIYEIRASFSKELSRPVLSEKYPSEIYGINDTGRMHISSSIQTVTNGTADTTKLYVWWAKTQKEFDIVKKQTAAKKNPLVWLKDPQMK